jgi:di/tripeptidase
MNCDQIIYLGIFAIVAIYLYQNVLTPQREYFNVGANMPMGNSNTAVHNANRAAANANAAAVNANMAAKANANSAVNAAQRAAKSNAAASAKATPQTAPGVRASEPLGKNEMSLPVQFNRTPSQCYPQNTLTAGDLLPSEESKEISEFNQNYPIGEGVLKGINFLSSGYHIGVNTVGQSLRNANRQLRSEPPNPQVSVSPWMNSSIGPDLLRRPLEVGDSCGKGGPPPSGNSI